MSLLRVGLLLQIRGPIGAMYRINDNPIETGDFRGSPPSTPTDHRFIQPDLHSRLNLVPRVFSCCMLNSCICNHVQISPSGSEGWMEVQVYANPPCQQTTSPNPKLCPWTLSHLLVSISMEQKGQVSFLPLSLPFSRSIVLYSVHSTVQYTCMSNINRRRSGVSSIN